MTKGFYDLEQIRDIPIVDVCAAFGVKIDRAGKCRIRPDDKSPSCQLYTKNASGQDTFYDFGSLVGGDVIHFVMALNGCDWQTALDTLADTFGIEPVNNTDYQNRSELTDYQYGLIGIYGDLATKNFDFDLERYSLESVQKFSDKYHMSVNELRKEYPGVYTTKILIGRALPYVTDLRNNYYAELYDHYQLAKAVGVSDPTQLAGASLENFEKDKNALAMAEKLLNKAVKGTSLEESIKMRHYDVQEDYLGIINGKISFQVGAVPYYEIKSAAARHDAVVHYHSVSMDDFVEMKDFLEDVSYAAFYKNGEVNLAFLPEDVGAIEKSLEALKVRRRVNDALAQEAVASQKQERTAFEMEL